MGDKENPQKPKIILRKADEEETIIKLKKQAIEYEIKLAYQQRELQEKDKKIRELITDIIDAEKEIALIKKATPEIVLETIKQVCKQKPQETNSEQDLPTPAKQQPPKVTPTTQPKNALETYQTELTQIKLNAKNLEERLNAQIIGQEEINKKIKERVRGHFGGLRAKKPLVFFSRGQTGVGKTYTAKILNKELFANLPQPPEPLQFSAADYFDSHKINILIGSAPGYVGYEEGGMLPSFIKRTSGRGLIIIDEIEKGHKSLHNFLLQLMDEGKITVMEPAKKETKNTPPQDAGIKVYDCHQSIIMLTSNIGEQDASTAKTLGFHTKATDLEDKRQAIREEALMRGLPPEFRNRITEMLNYKPLEEVHIEKILELDIGKIRRRVAENYPGQTIRIDEKAKQKIISEGFKPEFGARELERTLEKYVSSEEKIISLLEEKKSVLVTANDKGFIYIEMKNPISQVVI